ncbi:MAG: hypothetical protein ABIS07_12380 [Dokdonella sp.]
MLSLAQLWLPIVLSAVFVFFASSLFNMLLKFWHAPDYRAFSNEDEVRAAIRKGTTGPGMYHLPFCVPEKMKDPQMQEKFRQGPNAHIFVRPNGMMNMGAYLGQWFGFCAVVSVFCALLSVHALPAGAPFAHVFHLIGLAALLGYAFGSIPNAIWWGHPWGSTIKYVIDGVIYALITAATFAWLWPAA